MFKGNLFVVVIVFVVVFVSVLVDIVFVVGVVLSLGKQIYDVIGCWIGVIYCVMLDGNLQIIVDGKLVMILVLMFFEMNGKIQFLFSKSDFVCLKQRVLLWCGDWLILGDMLWVSWCGLRLLCFSW